MSQAPAPKMIMLAPSAALETLHKLHEHARMIRGVQNVTLDKLKEYNYQRYIQEINIPPTLQTIKKFLGILILCCESNWEFPLLSTTISRPFKPAVILASYMITLHPGTTFGLANNFVQPLMMAAHLLTQQFDKITECMESAFVGDSLDMGVKHVAHSTKTPLQTMDYLINLTRGFCQNLRDYETKFAQWKVADEPQAIALNYNAMCTSLAIALRSTNDFDQLYAKKDPFLNHFFRNIGIIRGRLDRLNARDEIKKFDDLLDTVINRLRHLRSIREEHVRQGLMVDETHHGFDFVDN